MSTLVKVLAHDLSYGRFQVAQPRAARVIYQYVITHPDFPAFVIVLLVGVASLFFLPSVLTFIHICRFFLCRLIQELRHRSTYVGHQPPYDEPRVVG